MARAFRGEGVEMSASRAQTPSSPHSREYQPYSTVTFKSLDQEPVGKSRYHKSVIDRGG